MNTTEDYSKLTQRDITELRQKIDPGAYKRSMSTVWFWCIFDLAFYIFFMYEVFAVQSVVAKIIFGLLAGVAASAMFVLAHDAAHGAMFKNKWVAEVLGTVYMLPALNSYRLWCFGHNRIHHGFTSFSPIDWIWRPLTIDEYSALGWFKKLLYRAERSLWGCGLHYIVKVWWPKMVMFMPDDLQPSKVRAIKIGKLVVVVFAVVLGIFAYVNSGFIGVLSTLVLPFIVFNYVISLIIYLHHTHPQIPFFDERTEWNHTIGAVFCTTVIHTNWLIDRFITHHILIHTPHHADIRIPFYRLKMAFNSIKDHYSEYIHEYRMSWSTLLHIFRSCKLYDYKKHVWYNFSVAKSC
ncbi:MAG: fatty acid desaturase [Pseudomonadota bacterium]|nr:fatty acid desaturase [Pseudomonadota bacterium]